MRSILLTAACAAALAACSDGAETTSEPVAEAPAGPEVLSEPASAPPLPSEETAGASETIGGDGAPLELVGLHRADIEGRLEGELGCTFWLPDDGPRLLIASAFVGDEFRSQAVVKIGDTVEPLVSRTEGGFDAMVDGTAYGGKGLTAEIAHDGVDLAEHEGHRYAATLTVDRGDGAQRAWEGVWTCGP